MSGNSRSNVLVLALLAGLRTPSTILFMTDAQLLCYHHMGHEAFISNTRGITYVSSMRASPEIIHILFVYHQVFTGSEAALR